MTNRLTASHSLSMRALSVIDHQPLDRETLIDMLSIGEVMLARGKTEALAQHLAFIRSCIEVDYAVAQVIYARETGECSEAFLCQ